MGATSRFPSLSIKGRRRDPGCTFQVAQHGVEINALEAVRRVVFELDLDEMMGTLVYCLPNPIAFYQRETVMSYDYIPGGMNRVWPGRPDGSLTERIAYEIWTKLIEWSPRGRRGWPRSSAPSCST